MARFKITRGESVGAYRAPGRGFTLIELIVVISLIAFLSNVVIKQIATGLEEKNLEATISNVGIYFSNASRLARASGQWVIVVVNVNKDDEGFLRQMGTYQWFEGEEPGESTRYIDINGNGQHDKTTGDSRTSSILKGWNVEDPKGFWLPSKIYFNLERSGPAKFESGKSSFSTVEPFSSGEKYLFFAMKHQNQANAGTDPAEVTKRGRLPFFLDRSGGAQNLTVTGVDSELASEIRFSKSSNAKEWIFFAFDRYGRYVNIKSGAVLGTGAPQQAQQDFIVISQGYLDPNDITLIRGLHQKEPLHTAFLLHRTGSFTISQDDNQVPSKIN